MRIELARARARLAHGVNQRARAERHQHERDDELEARVEPRRELGADKLSVRFQGLAAISDVSLTVQRHEVFGLIGPNGAGKTTLVNCLTGFQRPTEGRVILGGIDTAGWPTTRFREHGVARTFQAGRLFKDMTVTENVEVTAAGLGLSLRGARAHAKAMLAWIGLSDKASLHAGALAYTPVAVAADIDTQGAYVSDILQITRRWTVTLAGRWNGEDIRLTDLTGTSPMTFKSASARPEALSTSALVRSLVWAASWRGNLMFCITFSHG